VKKEGVHQDPYRATSGGKRRGKREKKERKRNLVVYLFLTMSQKERKGGKKGEGKKNLTQDRVGESRATA